MVETRNFREVDRISMLPDELIHRIMRFLQTKYAVQTSVLSKRWIHIWKSLPFLNFDTCGYTLDNLNDLIDRVFMLRDDCDIEWFRLRVYYFDHSITTSVSRWIDASVRRNVEDVTLELSHAHPDFTYEIPPKLLNCKSLKRLALVCFRTYEIPPKLFNCKSLKRLALVCFRTSVNIILPVSMCLPQLQFMYLGGITLPIEALSTRLFSSCPVLETLDIFHCDIQTDNQRNFTVESPGLKKFAYTHRNQNSISYYGHQIKPQIIMLSAPNLTSFTCNYEDHNQQLSTEEKEVNAICMVKLLVAVNKVEQLVLSPGFLKILTRATNLLNCQLHCLCNLQCLRLETWFTGGSLRTIAYLLTISPNIKTLTLKLTGPNLVDDGDDLELGFSFPSMLSHLNIVRIEEMVGCDAELKLLKFLLKNAKVLEKVILFFPSSGGYLDTVRRVDIFKDKLRALPRASSNIKKDVNITFADNNLKILM